MNRPLIVFLESYVAGGADRVVANVIARLPPVPVQIHLNARCDPSVLLAAPLPANVSLHYYEWPTIAEWSIWARGARGRLGRFVRRGLVLAARYPWLLVLAWRCYWRFRRIDPRAVWINNGGYPGGDVCRMATVAAAWLTDCTVVHLVHSPAQAPRAALRLPERLIDRWVDRSATLVAVAGSVAESLRSRRAIRQFAEVLHNGLSDAPPPSPPPVQGGLRLLMVGYLDRNKNHALAIRALGILRKRGVEDVRLTIVGKEAEPGLLAELKDIAAKEGLAGQVHFTGFACDVGPYYADCDALLLTSRVEGFPMCVLEAMRAARAVLSTRVGGVPELVRHGATGWLLASFDASELADVVQAWHSDRHSLGVLGSAGRERFVRSFRVETQVDVLARLLGLADGKAAQPRSVE